MPSFLLLPPSAPFSTKTLESPPLLCLCQEHPSLSGSLPPTSTMLHRYADDVDDSCATFHTARASSFCSTANSAEVSREKRSSGTADSTVRESVGGNSSILFGSGSVDYHATYGKDDRMSRTSPGIKSGGSDRKEMRRSRARQDSSLRLQHYLRRKMLRQLREGDNGTSYLVELKQKNRTRTDLYTIKIMHKNQSSSKFWAVETERNMLGSLNHPFLPSVYADIESEEFAFLVMDFCPLGNLRALLRRSPLGEEVARTYAAEVLLAMEYLHEQGIIYRGLKPENVLIRADGHIMLSSFDRAMWRRPPLPPSTRSSNSRSGTTCFGGFLQHVVGFESGEEVISRGDVRNPPEVLNGKEHDDDADWYTYGIFLYELLFGTTPSKAHDNRVTCINVGGASRRLKFPREPAVSPAARDLLRRLLNVNPKRRLGHYGGAAEVKQHAFFHGTNFSLLREMAAGCRKPPELPKF